jgi:hypothetical protein
MQQLALWKDAGAPLNCGNVTELAGESMPLLALYV